MAFDLSYLARIQRLIEDGERRIVAQEDRIERLRLAGHPTGDAENFLHRMKELRKLQLKLRDEAEQRVRPPAGEGSIATTLRDHRDTSRTFRQN